jgi:hypothetical protein
MNGKMSYILYLLLLLAIGLGFKFFNYYMIITIIKNVLFWTNVVICTLLSFVLMVMIVYYRSEDGAFRRPHSIFANKADNSLLHKSIKIAICGVCISSASFYILV